MPSALRRALVCLGAFLLPALLFSALGAAGGLMAAAIASALLAFGVRRTGAVLAGASLAAGTAWHGFLRPLGLYRSAGLAPRAFVGTDGEGGVFVRTRTGEVFHAGAEGGWERLPLPPGLALGRVGMRKGLVTALEIRPEGDRLWRVAGASAAPVAVGGSEPVLVADWDFDGALPVAVDALGGRLVWVGADGRLTRALRPPPEAGAPRLVAAGRGGVHVYTAAGAVLSLSPKGNWSVLSLPPPPGRALSLAHAAGRFTLLMRGERSECSAWDLVGGVSGRWRRREEEGPCAQFTADADRSYALGRRSVTAAPRAGRPSALGPPRAVTRAFDRTPVGALLGLVE
ncbi:hypothetical protein EPO15_16070 [bacterium]|nr:MAG: hypothetical protein EPO15_16070 [bacterium]